ncbi:MAG: hypothetical protein QNK05_11700 [Myxococcota bacterium]|nr:hypothetical protein [Myxococcota bacterium]
MSRGAVWVSLLALSLLADVPVHADIFDRAPGLVRGGGVRDPLTGERRSPATTIQRDQRRSLDRFVADKLVRSRIDAAAGRRVLERDIARRELLRGSTEAQRRLFLQRVEREDAADLGALRGDLARLEREAGRPLGPITRGILEAALAAEERRQDQAREALSGALAPPRERPGLPALEER